MGRSLAAALILGLSALGCTARREGTEPAPAELADMVLERLPEGATRTHFDFGGKVSLVGFQAEPAGDARPGDTIKVRLYWRAVGKLSDGWRLFTHLVNDRGIIIGNYDLAGPLRRNAESGAPLLGPSHWLPGKIYLDELAIEVPSPQNRPVTDRITLVAGVWRRNMRLDVRGGPGREQAAVVAHFRTGASPTRHVAESH